MHPDLGTENGQFMCSSVRIDGVGPQAATTALLESRYGRPQRVHLCNSWTLALAVRDREYRRQLNGSDLNLADGHYVAMVGRWRGHAGLTERVYGPALMLSTMDQGRAVGLRHYLYGATPKTVNRLAGSLQKRFPGIQVVGVEAPPFRPLTAEEEDGLSARIADARPDIVWVGLGTPRQDSFVARYAEALKCTLVPVGAAFDFNSGTKRAAPALIQRAGMEWLYRFAKEPRRLWRRYLIGIPIFMYGVAADLWWDWRNEDPPTDHAAMPQPALRSLGLAAAIAPRSRATTDDMALPGWPAYAGLENNALVRGDEA
jgi:N-acetylglucosaminyldiphosphoundecaprenol N-acetyl-beta-D-mannosaminyltransferase